MCETWHQESAEMNAVGTGRIFHLDPFGVRHSTSFNRRREEGTDMRKHCIECIVSHPRPLFPLRRHNPSDIKSGPRMQHHEDRGGWWTGEAQIDWAARLRLWRVWAVKWISSAIWRLTERLRACSCNALEIGRISPEMMSCKCLPGKGKPEDSICLFFPGANPNTKNLHHVAHHAKWMPNFTICIHLPLRLDTKTLGLTWRVQFCKAESLVIFAIAAKVRVAAPASFRFSGYKSITSWGRSSIGGWAVYFCVDRVSVGHIHWKRRKENIWKTKLVLFCRDFKVSGVLFTCLPLKIFKKKTWGEKKTKFGFSPLYEMWKTSGRQA